MSNIALIYWLTRLSSISNFFLTLGIISVVVIGIGILGYSVAMIDCYREDEEIEYRQKRKKFFDKIS